MARIALSWEEIVERGKQHNKTVICEVEKLGEKKYFLIRCNKCDYEVKQAIRNFSVCKRCFSFINRSNSEEYIEKAKKVHGEKYNYDSVDYLNLRTKIKILCNQCKNIFEQRPRCHLEGRGCSSCSYKLLGSKKRSNKEEFILKAKIVHENKYCYDLVEYETANKKIKIQCNNCNNIFEQEPYSHLRGCGCKQCADINQSLILSEFIEKAEKVHGEKYNYDLVEYKNSQTKIKILCNQCKNIFEQVAHYHLDGCGCKDCSLQNSYFSRTYTTDEFIEKAKKVHGDKYNYDSVDYLKSKIKVNIFCNKCKKIFSQMPMSHLKGVGCANCKESKGEIKISKYLNNISISFATQKSFESLKNIIALKFDFYLDDINLLIEYDGEGHYFPCFGSTLEQKQKNLEDCQRRDKIKNEWALKNNIPLLRIPYWDFDRIEELIDAFILQHTKKKEIKQLVLEM